LGENDDAGQTFLLEPMDAPLKRKKSNKKTYVGWASKQLTEFISSIGNDSTKPPDHYRVTRVARDYINQHNLHDVQKEHQNRPKQVGTKGEKDE